MQISSRPGTRRRGTKGRPSAAFFVLGALCTSALAFAATATPPVVARWRGGELTLARFLDAYDPGGSALLAGGEDLRVAVAKASFLEIESQQAAALGLADDPAVRAELEAADAAALAMVARRHLGPVPQPTATEIAAAWATRRAEILPPATEVDLDVLFVRCPLRQSARTACDERLRQLLARIQAGETWEAVAKEEQERSGPANGHFDGASLDDLVDDLAAAAATLPIGETSGIVASPSGLFALRVLRRGERPAPELAAMQPLVRQFLVRERERAAIAALAVPVGTPDEPEARLAAYARAAGLDQTEDGRRALETRRRWVLADAAFARDPQAQPSADEVRAALAAEPERWRPVSLVLAILPAARGERSSALERAARITDELAASETPEALLRALPEREAGAHLRVLEAAGEAELAALDPLLREALAQLVPGRLSGPWPVATPEGSAAARSPSRHGARYSGLAFLLLRERLPPDELAVAEELRRRKRSNLGGGVEAFLEIFGRPRGLELLVP